MHEFLRHSRAFLLVWAGQSVSLVGSALTAFALGVWVFQETSSTTQYALVMFCATLPAVLLLPFVGPLLDRFPRKRLLVLCDVAAALGTAATGLLAGSGNLSLWNACAVIFVIASAGAVQWPTYAATVTLLVERAELGRASGMTQLAQAISHVAAPLLAGGLIAAIGLAGITAIDFATFLVSLGTLLAARIPAPPERPKRERDYLGDLALGWRTIFANPGLLSLLLMFALINFFSELATVLFTPFVLSFSTASALGTIVGVGGLGLVAGSLAMTVSGGPRRPAQGAAFFAALGGVAILAAGFTTSIAALAAIAATFFFFLPLTAGSSQVVWQRKVAPEIQGRVFATRSAIAMSIVPLASLAAGPLADAVFEPAMAEGGAWAGTLGVWIGTGPGRGMALILVACGLASVLVACGAVLLRPLRGLDQEAICASASPTPPVPS